MQPSLAAHRSGVIPLRHSFWLGELFRLVMLYRFTWVGCYGCRRLADVIHDNLVIPSSLILSRVDVEVHALMFRCLEALNAETLNLILSNYVEGYLLRIITFCLCDESLSHPVIALLAYTRLNG